MTQGSVSDERLDRVEAVLRGHRARFAFVHGSRAHGTESSSSDLDVAAWFGQPVDPSRILADLPTGVDLLVLDTAALELAGRVAQHGVLILDADPAARVAWQATTRKCSLADHGARRRDARRRSRGDDHARPP